MNFRSLSLVALVLTSVGCGADAPTSPMGSAGTPGAGGAGSGAGGMAGDAPVAGSAGGGAGGTAAGMAGMAGSGGVPNLMPTKLSETGLFSDVQAGTLAPGVYAFTPQYPLWSDGATKRRWVYMPPNAKITTDGTLNGMEFWEFPTGFKLWKEFTRDGKRIETRLIMKTGGLADWYMVAFKWNEDGSDATATIDGEMNAMGTMHDIPGQQGCKGCHNSMYDNVLGFSALQLNHTLPDSLNLTQIEQMGWLSKNPDVPPAIAGTEVEKAALGYLHANCGMCHNENAPVYATTKAALDLWWHLDATSIATSPAYLSMVCDEWPGAGGKFMPIGTCTAGHATGAVRETDISELAKRIAPGDPELSAVHELMALRVGPEDKRQMPPLGTEMPDPTGLAAVEAWINSLPAQ